MTAPARWFGFNLGFSCDGPDLDTVHATLARLVGWTVHVECWDNRDVDRIVEDVIIGGFECPDDPANDWPVYVTGWRYAKENWADDFRGEPVRFKLRDARITIY